MTAATPEEPDALSRRSVRRTSARILGLIDAAPSGAVSWPRLRAVLGGKWSIPEPLIVAALRSLLDAGTVERREEYGRDLYLRVSRPPRVEQRVDDLDLRIRHALGGRGDRR